MTIHGMQGRGRASIFFVATAALLLVSAGALSACGDDDDGGSTHPDAAPGAVDAAIVDGGLEMDADLGDWKVLNEGSWTIPAVDPQHPAADPYYCIITTLHEDVYIKAFKGLIPTGTHHTVLTVYDGNQADGIIPCNASMNGQSMIYGTGIGTPPFYYPDGVGLHLTAGTRLINNLHLFNATDGTLNGTSGTLYLPAQPSEIAHEAQVVLAGPVQLSIPPSGSATVQSGTCQISNITNEPIQVFSISPHMHRLGRHLRSFLVRGGQETLIQDVDYSFESQTFTLTQPFIELRPGDGLRTECTYEYPGTPGVDPTVGFGSNSDDEMCFTDIGFFPAQAGRYFICPGT